MEASRTPLHIIQCVCLSALDAGTKTFDCVIQVFNGRTNQSATRFSVLMVREDAGRCPSCVRDAQSYTFKAFLFLLLNTREGRYIVHLSQYTVKNKSNEK